MISAEVIDRLQLTAELRSFGKLQNSIHLIVRLLLPRNSFTTSSCRTLNALVSVNCQLDTSPVRTKITAATSSLSVSTDPLANTGVYVQAVNATHDR